jgi:HEAT repeat protein
MALLNFGREATEPLIGALNSSSWTIRFRAARLLGELGDPQTAAALEHAMARKGERKDVREIIESSLGRLKK